MLAAAAGQSLHQKSGKAVSAQGPCQTPPQALQGEKTSAHASKAKHKNCLRWQSPSRVQRKCFYNHSRHQSKYVHLEKLVFHHIMYKQSHLETLNTHQMQQPQLVESKELYSALVMAQNV